MPYCENCGAQISSTAKFCSSCGIPRTQNTAPFAKYNANQRWDLALPNTEVYTSQSAIVVTNAFTLVIGVFNSVI